MKKILIIFGTRPEAIKMAPLIHEFKNYKSIFNVKVCVTAQHRGMLDQVMSLFDIVPDYDLDIMSSNQDLYKLTSRMLVKIKPVLDEFLPDLVIVHGDTSTCFVGSLAAYYQKIPIAHIEAGLRTWDLFSPWPEEGNRQLVKVLTSLHFAPTSGNMKNLINEGVKESSIFVTGNTVIDALKLILNNIKNDKDLELKIKKNIINSGFFDIDSKFILVTGHRRENFGKGFLEICEALKKIAENNPNIKILYPVHLNPNVKKPVHAILENIKNVVLVEPFQYAEFVYLMSRAYLILTDSGGIQEEAPSIGKPVLVMRETTERPEALKSGTIKLVGSDKTLIVKEVQALLDDTKLYNKISKSSNPYGTGKSSKKIIEIIKSKLYES